MEAENHNIIGQWHGNYLPIRVEGVYGGRSAVYFARVDAGSPITYSSSLIFDELGVAISPVVPDAAYILEECPRTNELRPGRIISIFPGSAVFNLYCTSLEPSPVRITLVAAIGHNVPTLVLGADAIQILSTTHNNIAQN